MITKKCLNKAGLISLSLALLVLISALLQAFRFWSSFYLFNIITQFIDI